MLLSTEDFTSPPQNASKRHRCVIKQLSKLWVVEQEAYSYNK